MAIFALYSKTTVVFPRTSGQENSSRSPGLSGWHLAAEYTGDVRERPFNSRFANRFLMDEFVTIA